MSVEQNSRSGTIYSCFEPISNGLSRLKLVLDGFQCILCCFASFRINCPVWPVVRGNVYLLGTNK